jgi:hypothetical protein
MKTIDTLVPDIYEVLRNQGTELSVEQQAAFGAGVARKLSLALNKVEWKRPPKTLRMSEIGKPCVRSLWYTVHHPQHGEKLLPHTRMKFLYGDIIEEQVLFLAKVAGHKVEGEQERLEMEHNGWKIVGHRDAIIDDVLVDVKSASSYSFKKFQEGMNDDNDAFGYRMQLQAYDEAERRTKRRLGWVAVDKQNGTVCFSEHTKKIDFYKRLDAVTRALDNPVVPPGREFAVLPEGKSGNLKLGVECSYCAFKKECWKDSNAGYGLRAFAYDRGPVFLTEVVRTPNVPEISLEADSETSTESASATSTPA